MLKMIAEVSVSKSSGSGTTGGTTKPLSRNPSHWRSATHLALKPHKVSTNENLLTLSGGKWNVPPDKYLEFLRRYARDHNSYWLGHVQRQSPVFPLIVDLDHLEDYVAAPLLLLKQVVDALREVLTVAGHAEAAEGILFQHRGQARFHLVCPQVCVNTLKAKNILNQVATVLMKRHDTVRWPEVIDERLTGVNGLRMLGAFKFEGVYHETTDEQGEVKKTPVLSKYKDNNGVDRETQVKQAHLEKGYYLPCEIDFEAMRVTDQAITFERLQQHSIYRPDLKEEDMLPGFDQEIPADQWMFETETPFGPKPSAKRKPESRNLPAVACSERPPAEEVSFELLERVVLLQKPSRAVDYYPWAEVAWAIFNTSVANGYWPTPGRQLIHTFSKQAPDYDKQKVDSKIDTMTYKPPGVGVHFGSLVHHLKEDNPMDFDNIQSERKGRTVAKSMEYAIRTGGSHVAVAKVAHAVLGPNYRATSVNSSRAWFCFDGTRWQKHDDGQLLRDLTEKVQPLFALEAQQLEAKVAQTTDTATKEKLEKRRCSFNKLGNTLLNNSYRNSVMKEFAALVQEQGFEAKLDANVNLLGFDDGVYDLAAGVFRQGRPEDYLTKSVGYTYPAESHGHEAAIEQFVCRILPNLEMRTYLLCLLAQKLCGACIKRVCIHTGLGGDNGKTTLFELILQAFGDYGFKAKIQMFTAKRLDAGKADPDSAMLRGVRVVFSEEPDEGARLNIGLLKDLSGGGAFSFRLLFSNEVVSTEPQFMLNFACNKMFEVDGSDGGAHNRLNKFDYRSRFVDTESEVDDGAFRFKKDISIKEQFSAWSPDFMRMLLRLYKHGHVPPVPAGVKASTSTYLEANNHYARFQQLFVEAAEDHENFTARDALETWRTYEVSHDLGKPPNKAQLTEGLTLLMRCELHQPLKMVNGKRRRSAWWGWRLREEPVEDDDEEEVQEEKGSQDTG